ncbi:MAG: hypothetical protein O2822_06065 [Chloroflexi bacterium]|nr:hypothetical protein [Chloroflexota bacterium]
MTGCSSKLCSGGGLLICHSSVLAPHGFAAACFPRTHERIMFTVKKMNEMPRTKPDMEIQ